MTSITSRKAFRVLLDDGSEITSRSRDIEIGAVAHGKTDAGDRASGVVVEVLEEMSLDTYELTFGHRVSSKAMPPPVETSFDALVSRISDPVVTDETPNEYAAMSREQQSVVKDVGYYIAGHVSNGERRRDNVASRSMITLDIDHLESDDIEPFKAAYADYEYVIHSTHKHRADSPRLRLIVPMAYDIAGDDIKARYEAVSRALASVWGMDAFDDTTYQHSRAMHLPSISTGGDWFFHRNRGSLLDPVTLLSDMSISVDSVESWPRSSRQKGLRLSADKAQDPLLKRGIVGAFCRHFDIHDAISRFIPDTYSAGDYPRYTYARSTGSNGAVAYDGDTLLYSHHEKDPAFGKSLNAFDLVRLHRFGDIDTQESFIKMCRLAETVPDVVRTRDILNAEDEAEELGIESADAEWLLDLDRNPKTGKVLGNSKNAVLIIRNDAELKGKIKLNLFSRDTVFLGARPWGGSGDDINGTLFGDRDLHLLRDHMRSRYGSDFGADTVDHAVQVVADGQQYHPVTDYLESLAWDGKPRLDTVFIDWMGARDSRFTRAATRKFFCAAVARVFDPGVKFDHVLILEGAQGLGKSSILSALGRSWFTDNMDRFASKESIENMRGKWVIELGELAGIRGKSADDLKAFITRQVDRMRAAYSRRSEDYPRQCVFAGTANGSGYLEDATGNRRFWPVAVFSSLNRDDFESVVDQIWAEAVHAYRAGEPLYLDDKSIESEAKVEQGDRVHADEWVGMIETYLEQEIDINEEDGLPALGVTDKRSKVCVKEIWEVVFGKSSADIKRPDSARIGRCLTLLGWTETRNIRHKTHGVQAFRTRPKK